MMMRKQPVSAIGIQAASLAGELLLRLRQGAATSATADPAVPPTSRVGEVDVNE